jgi:predicted DCC family thiol-disulfide oxidoreductase YuxK
VRFVRKADGERDRFGIAPLGGETFQALVPVDERRALPDSLVVRTGEGNLLVRSAALAHILSGMGRGARVVAALLRAVPRPIRDCAYDALAYARRLVPRVRAPKP